jgi:hypothetical protein
MPPIINIISSPSSSSLPLSPLSSSPALLSPSLLSFSPLLLSSPLFSFSSLLLFPPSLLPSLPLLSPLSSILLSSPLFYCCCLFSYIFFRRQTIMFSAFPAPDINALFNKKCNSIILPPFLPFTKLSI